MIKCILFIILIFASAFCYAQNTDTLVIITDRPDLTESSRAVPFKSIQIETGVLMFVEQPDGNEKHKSILYQFPTTLVRVGLFKNAELRLINQFVNEHNNNPTVPIKDRNAYGIDNLTVGTKINILTEKGIIPEIALLSHVIIPTGSAQFKNNKVLYNAIFSLSHTLSSKFSVGYNIGWSTDGINPRGTGLYTLALSYTISPKLAVYSEFYGTSENLSTTTTGVDGGFTFLLSPKMQIDISAGKGFTQSNYFLSAGFSLLIPELF